MKRPTIHGRIFYRDAWRVMVGRVGPKWISFAFFDDGGEIKIRKVPRKDARHVKPVRDNRDSSTSSAFAKRMLRGRRKGMKKPVRKFLEAIA